MARTKPKTDLPLPARCDARCVECGLWARGGAQSPNMQPTGARRPSLYVVGMAPGKQEDAQDRQFVGKSGELLRAALRRAGIRPQQIRWYNAVNCWPPANRPTPHEQRTCAVRVREDIDRARPKVVLVLGNEALASLYERPPAIGITRCRGQAVPYRTAGGHECWVVPTYHPSYILRGVDESEERCWHRDLNLAASLLDEPTDTICPEPDEIRIAQTAGDLDAMFAELEAAEVVAFDYETTSLVTYDCARFPDPAGLWSLGIATDRSATAWTVPLWDAWPDRTRTAILSRFGRWLMREGPRKVAHNLLFEWWWSTSHLPGVDRVAPPYDDTQILAWLLCTEQGMSKLKVAAWWTMGVANWSVGVTRILASKDPPETILRYNALDAWYTLRLHELLVDVMPRRLRRLYDSVLLPSVPVFAGMVSRGVRVDLDRVDALIGQFSGTRDEALALIRDLSGGAVERVTNRELQHYFEAQGYELLRMGKTGWSVDEESVRHVVDTYGDPLAEAVLIYRKADKVISTYLESSVQYLDGGGRIHPSYGIATTVTGRTSSSGPNIQNFPKRDPHQYVVRSMIVPEEGEVLLSADYGQLEARLFGVVTGDDALCTALWEGYDIHTDFACWLYGVDRDDPEFKARRSTTKNGVFAAFYGAGVDRLAATLDVPARRAEQFRNRLFDQFPDVRSWQREEQARARRQGYVESLFGARRYMPMRYSEILNHRIQSTGAHMLVASLPAVNSGIRVLMEVHDDITLSVPEADVQRAARWMALCMLSVPWSRMVRTSIRAYVPMMVEFSVGPDWGSQREVEVITAQDLDLVSLDSAVEVAQAIDHGELTYEEV